ncbi:MAG: hypothetical protein JJE39_17945 [Vicinamibacteria bacterium]|nr:hypothetical protein [Vicinamibacteria bacterium]
MRTNTGYSKAFAMDVIANIRTDLDAFSEVEQAVGFHVDPAAIRAGLRGLETVTDPIVIIEGDGPEIYRSHLPLGLAALLQGIGLSADEITGIVPLAAEHQMVPRDLQDVFRTVAKKRGLAILSHHQVK